MNKELKAKEQTLSGILKNLQGCVIAFSGGLDSTYLAVFSAEHTKGRVLCVTVADPSTPESDLESARKAAARHGLEHMVLISGIDPKVRENPPDRCYICKLRLFQRLEEIRARECLTAILDGENASDSDDDRPGSRAARECGVLSPLAQAGLTKADIRSLAKSRGLEEWARPASACLASRIPYGTPIDDAILRKIDMTEDFIRSRGIAMIRARLNGNGARLEIGQDENTQENRAMLVSLKHEIKSLGWDDIEIDPGGYVPAGLRSRNNEK